MPKSSPDSVVAKRRSLTVWICVALAALTWLVFGQTLWHSFINYDDNAYVYQNPVVMRGLTLDGIGWAFTHVHSGNWHPVTSMSHMLDCQLYGLRAGGHHFTNVLLHSIGVVLLFLVMRQMTGALWRSAFVAVIFAIHPLRVESVAWIAERKDVLSGVFFMLTLWAYQRYVRNSPSLQRYLMVAFLFALGLMSKPTLTPLPFLLLLLDYWPLRRFEQISPIDREKPGWWRQRSLTTRVILEKIPLLALSVVSSVATILAQRHTISSTEQLPLAWRLGNAAVSYVIYLRKMVWPAHLAVYYQHPGNTLPAWEIVSAIAFLTAISVCAILLRRKQPSFLVGWFWYLGMLVPVIGIVQVGQQAYADRYTYLPHIGISIMATWGIARITENWRWRREVLAAAFAVIMIAAAWRAWWQTAFWRQSEVLWLHTLAVTSDTAVADNALGEELLRQGRLDEAIARFEIAARLDPGFRDAASNLGVALLQKGRTDEALVHLQNVLQNYRGLCQSPLRSWSRSTPARPPRRSDQPIPRGFAITAGLRRGP